MKLNHKNSGFPTWPNILLDEKNGCFEVSGKHVTYRRYLMAHWLFRFMLILPWIVVIFLRHDDFTLVVQIALFFGIPYLIVVGILSMLPMPWLIARLFFPRFMRARFTHDKIWIDGKTYDAPGNMSIQFRSQRPALPQHKFNRITALLQAERVRKHESDKLKFRVIEMIYGRELIPLTTVADEDRAAQFVIALQVGLELAKSHAAKNASAPEELARTREFDDALPE